MKRAEMASTKFVMSTALRVLSPPPPPPPSAVELLSAIPNLRRIEVPKVLPYLFGSHVCLRADQAVPRCTGAMREERDCGRDEWGEVDRRKKTRGRFFHPIHDSEDPIRPRLSGSTMGCQPATRETTSARLAQNGQPPQPLRKMKDSASIPL